MTLELVKSSKQYLSGVHISHKTGYNFVLDLTGVPGNISWKNLKVSTSVPQHKAKFVHS